MDIDFQKKKSFIINFAYYTLILAIVFIIFKFILPLILPFVIGFIISMILKPLINHLTKKSKINRKILSVFVLLIFYGIIVFFLVLLGIKMSFYIKEVFLNLPSIYRVSIEPVLNSLFYHLETNLPDVSNYVVEFLKSTNQSLVSLIDSLSLVVVNFFTGIAGRIPRFVVNMIFSVISSLFFTLDYQRITCFMVRQFPKDKKHILFNVKNNGIGTVVKYFKAYGIILCLTFGELTIALAILGVKNLILTAAIIALIDIIPVLGTGFVLLPWAALEFLKGNYYLTLGFLITYAIVSLVRYLLEPKIVGQKIGLHPLVTLMSMFVGVQLFGFWGIFGLPIGITILKNLNDNKLINIFR